MIIIRICHFKLLLLFAFVFNNNNLLKTNDFNKVVILETRFVDKLCFVNNAAIAY